MFAQTAQTPAWVSKPVTSCRLSDSLQQSLALNCSLPKFLEHVYHHSVQTHSQKSLGNFQTGAFTPSSGLLQCPVSILSFSTVACQRHNIILKQFLCVHLAHFPWLSSNHCCYWTQDCESAKTKMLTFTKIKWPYSNGLSPQKHLQLSPADFSGSCTCSLGPKFKQLSVCAPKTSFQNQPAVVIFMQSHVSFKLNTGLM